MQTQGNGSSAVSRAQGDESPVVPRKKKEEGSTSKQKQDYVSITPSYSRVSEKLRRISSGSLQCSLFCGGQRCKYENVMNSDSSESDHCSLCYELFLTTDGFHWCCNTGCSLGYCTSLVTHYDLSKRDLSTRLVLHM